LIILWLVFVLMTAAAVFAVLWPLSRRGVARRGGSDVVVYRDQLDEIARDRAAGLIGEAEAQAARVELSRRLIAAVDSAETATESDAGARDRSSLWRRRITAVVALLLVPAGATALYLHLGSPQLPGEPLAARLRAIHENAPIAKLVAQVEAHLAKDPNDARGYEVLAPVYLRLGRFADAVSANRKIIALAGETAERQADLGEALTAAANGVVTDEAKTAFERALKLDTKQLKARFYTGVAAQQDGKIDKAAAIWRGMLSNAPANAPWLPDVRHALASIGKPVAPAAGAAASAGSTVPGPNAAQIANAANMNENDRRAMVRGMVARLAARLKQNGDDVAGWQTLVRSYRVLGDAAKMQAATADAERALAGQPDKLRAFKEALKDAPTPPASSARGPSAAEIAAASKMSAQDRNSMIHGMVARLADRLKQNGNDIEGWQRLLRAYMVLGERDKAQAAAADARKALAGDQDKLRRLEDMIKSLGLAS
jgi:cytochrome c-type biogenesis protein CcmH